MRVRVNLGAEPGSGILAMVGWSVVAHVVGLFLMIFMPRIIPREPPPPILLTAQIVSLPSSGPALPAPPPSGPTPSERAQEAARELTRKTAPPRPEKPPEKPKEPPRPRQRPQNVPPPPGEESSGKEEPEIPVPAPAAPLPEGGVGLGAGTMAGDPAIPSIMSGSFPFQYYRTTMVNQIRSRWDRPLTPGLPESLRCAVAFLIAKDGRILDAQISVPSGLAALDESALRAVLRTKRLPPLPYQYTSPSVRAELIFELTPD